MYGYRKQILCLDSVHCLTRGLSPGPLGVFSLYSPRGGAYAAIGRAGKAKPVVGQVRHRSGARCARLSILLPCDALDSIVLPGVIEHLAVHVGMRGALHFTAEVDEHAYVFEALRRSGFSVYARQRFWQLSYTDAEYLAPADGAGGWKPFRKADQIPVRSLYQSLVPALVQPMETPPAPGSGGLIYRRGGEVLGYADLVYGPSGTWIQPLIHPAAEEPAILLAELLAHLRRRSKRPVYLCIRSYQGWLEPALEDLSAEAGPRQVLMVKHLAMAQRSTVPVGLPSLEKGRAEQTPVINLQGTVQIDKTHGHRLG